MSFNNAVLIKQKVTHLFTKSPGASFIKRAYAQNGAGNVRTPVPTQRL